MINLRVFFHSLLAIWLGISSLFATEKAAHKESAFELRSLIASLGDKKIEILKAYEKPILDPTYDRDCRPLDVIRYAASKKLLELYNDELLPEDTHMHWETCNALDNFDEAYQTALMMMNRFTLTLEQLAEHQIYNLVTTFSYYEAVDPQNLNQLEEYLKRKGQLRYDQLIDLHINRGMHQQLVNFISSNNEEILKVFDGNYSERISNVVPSCLICKEYDLAFSVIATILDPVTKAMYQSLAYIAMGDQEKANQLLDNFKFVKKDGMCESEEQDESDFLSFLSKFFSRDLQEAIVILESIKPTKFSSSILIRIKEKTQFPEEQLQTLKSQYENTFGKPYTPFDLGSFKAIIDLILG